MKLWMLSFVVLQSCFAPLEQFRIDVSQNCHGSVVDIRFASHDTSVVIPFCSFVDSHGVASPYKFTRVSRFSDEGGRDSSVLSLIFPSPMGVSLKDGIGLSEIPGPTRWIGHAVRGSRNGFEMFLIANQYSPEFFSVSAGDTVWVKRVVGRSPN